MIDPVARVQRVVAEALARRGLRRAFVAFSGGPDSSALADAAGVALDPALVHLLHVDHGAPASDDAARHARAWAAARGFPIEVVRVVVGDGASWEARARKVRYRALRELAGPTELILTGHTATDQAETVLLQLVRGTGPAGLAGIARQRGCLVRPLLDVGRADIEAYVTARELAPWRDPMNLDPRFARVRVRRDVLPVLRGLNPRVDDALVRLARTAAEERRVVDAAALDLLTRAGPGPLACAPLAAADPTVAKRALARWLRARVGAADASHLDAVLDLIRGPDAGTRGLDLPGGRVERVYGRLQVASPRAARPALTVAGPDAPYQVRAWRPGDRMRPRRLRGRSRKLSDLYVDLKVPRADRAGARVVERGDGTIVWAEHVGPAHGVEVTVEVTGRTEGDRSDPRAPERST